MIGWLSFVLLIVLILFFPSPISARFWAGVSIFFGNLADKLDKFAEQVKKDMDQSQRRYQEMIQARRERELEQKRKSQERVETIRRRQREQR